MIAQILSVSAFGQHTEVGVLDLLMKFTLRTLSASEIIFTGQ